MTTITSNNTILLNVPELRDLIANCGSAAARAFGGRVINYILENENGDAHHLTVANGFVIESYWVSWKSGKPVVTDSMIKLGEWAWGLQLRSHWNYKICSSLPLSYYLESMNPSHADHSKIH